LSIEFIKVSQKKLLDIVSLLCILNCMMRRRRQLLSVVFVYLRVRVGTKKLWRRMIWPYSADHGSQWLISIKG